MKKLKETKNQRKIFIYTIKKITIKDMGKLENLLSFDDFDKNWKSKEQKLTKRTEVGVDVLNENLYMKVMDQTSVGWKENCAKFIQQIISSVNESQVKNIEVTNSSVAFTIRGRKYKINKNDGSLTLWRIKTNSFRKTYTDEGGRKKEERKRTKTRGEIEVTIPIAKGEATAIYNALKERSED